MPPESQDILVKSTPDNNSCADTWKKAWMATPGPKTFTEHTYLFLKGLGMGTADIVPGVSGGTIALITGIYEALLNAISSFSSRPFLQFLRLNFKQALSGIHLRFLTTLVFGIAFAIISTSHLIHFLLTEHPVKIWSVFFGLITASILVLGHSINNRFSSFPALILGTIFAYGITGLIPLNTPEELWFIFLSGMIAISAMILPGLSGSFILLILGKYAFITAALRNPFNPDNLEIILVFVAGCLVGVLGFSRILRYALERWHDYTLAVLTGIMLGSMRKVWPWKITLESQIIRGNEHTLREENVWPLLDFELGIALLLMGTGFLMVMLLDKVPKQQN